MPREPYRVIEIARPAATQTVGVDRLQAEPTAPHQLPFEVHGPPLLGPGQQAFFIAACSDADAANRVKEALELAQRLRGHSDRKPLED